MFEWHPSLWEPRWASTVLRAVSGTKAFVRKGTGCSFRWSLQDWRSGLARFTSHLHLLRNYFSSSVGLEIHCHSAGCSTQGLADSRGSTNVGEMNYVCTTATSWGITFSNFWECSGQQSSGVGRRFYHPMVLFCVFCRSDMVLFFSFPFGALNRETHHFLW